MKAPWRGHGRCIIKGKATFEILWWDVSIRVDTTLVEGEQPPLPEPIDVLPRLRKHWGIRTTGSPTCPLPAAGGDVTRGAGGGHDMLLHPLGTLAVKAERSAAEPGHLPLWSGGTGGERRFAISKRQLGGDKQVIRTSETSLLRRSSSR